MKNTLLLPHSFKWIGLALAILFLGLSIATEVYDFSFAFLAVKAPAYAQFSNDNLSDEFALSGLILSLMFISLAREKQEDEYVNNIRLESFQLAFIFHYVLLLFGIFTIYGLGFLGIMVMSMPVLLLLFLLIFYFRLKLLPLITRHRTA